MHDKACTCPDCVFDSMRVVVSNGLNEISLRELTEAYTRGVLTYVEYTDFVKFWQAGRAVGERI